MNVGGLGGTLHWAAAINQSYHPSPIPIPSPSPSTLVPAAGNLPICHKAQAIMSRRRACKCCQRHVAAAIAIRCAPVHVQGPVNGCAMAITAKPSNLKRHTPWRPGPASPAIRCPSLRNGPPAGKARSLACARMHTLDSQSRDDRELLCAAGPMASRVPPATSPQQSQSLPPWQSLRGE